MTVGDFVSEIPDLPEPVIGWRKWTRMSNGSLAGWSNDLWVPGEDKEARCIQIEYSYSAVWRKDEDGNIMACPSSPSPTKDGHAGHGCGIYAYKDAETLCRNVRVGVGVANVVVGKVLMWGNVFEHEEGWRSQYGAVHSIFDTDKESDHLVAKKYGVPLEPFPVSYEEAITLFSKEAGRRIAAGLMSVGYSPPAWKGGNPPASKGKSDG